MTNSEIKSKVNKLGIDFPGEQGNNNTYIVDLETDLDFGRVYSILETNDNVDRLDENSLLTVHNASLLYEYNNLQFNLKGDFDNDLYELVVSEIKVSNE